MSGIRSGIAEATTETAKQAPFQTVHRLPERIHEQRTLVWGTPPLGMECGARAHLCQAQYPLPCLQSGMFSPRRWQVHGPPDGGRVAAGQRSKVARGKCHSRWSCRCLLFLVAACQHHRGWSPHVRRSEARRHCDLERRPQEYLWIAVVRCGSIDRNLGKRAWRHGH